MQTLFRLGNNPDISLLAMAQETKISRKRGPAPTGVGTPIMVRCQPDLLAQIDAAMPSLNAKTRQEAIRIILRDWLAEHAPHVG